MGKVSRKEEKLEEEDHSLADTFIEKQYIK